MSALLDFVLPAGLEAAEPAEARGLRRDAVRLLVSSADSIRHATFRDLPDHLREGDLLVVNTSATLAAALPGRRTGDAVAVHVSTVLDDGSWVVELRPASDAHGPVGDAAPGQLVRLPDDVRLLLVEPYPEAGSGRFWRGVTDLQQDLPDYLARFGRPVTYGYVTGRYDLASYQTVFADEPGSAEMPSAGRPFTPELLARLHRAGVGIARITLHTGLSSAEDGEPPLPERFRVPASTAMRVASTRAAGGRVIAVGTTVTRALETAAAHDGSVRAAHGWTSLVLGGNRPVRVVDGIVTGWHAPGASHVHLLEAVVGRDRVADAYAAALAQKYLWHEFGDSALLLR